MEHNPIITAYDSARAAKAKAPSPLLVWLLRLAQFQPVGFVVMAAFVAVMVWGSAIAFMPGLVIGAIVMIALRRIADGNVRPSEAE